MKKIVILLLENCTPIAPIGAMELLHKSGLMHQQIHQTESPFFDVQLATIAQQTVQVSEGVQISCKQRIAEIDSCDLLLIPALDFDIEEKLEANAAAIPHIRRLFEQGAEVGSMCTGAFLLAKTGLLDGMAATTHWLQADRFRKAFPDVQLQDEKIVIDNGGIYCAGGATSFMSLILYLVEKFCGKETAVMASHMLLIDSRIPSQTEFALFTPQTSHPDIEILKAQRFIEIHIQEKIKIKTLAEEVGLGERTFIRRFKQATGDTPQVYIRRVKMEQAKRMLETEASTIEEIMYALGYQDKNAFRRAFVKHAGLNPSQYRQKYQLFR